jgi:hypothetical protein
MNRRNFISIAMRGLVGASPVIWTLSALAEEESTGDNVQPPEPSSGGAASDGKARWETLTPEQQQKVQERWEKFKSLPPERKQRILRAWHRYRKFSPERRQQMKSRWRRFQQMSPEQKQRFRQRFKKWKALSPGKRRELRQRFIERRKGSIGGLENLSNKNSQRGE